MDVGPVISVRGTASLDVPPDAATLVGEVTVTRDTRQESLAQASAAVEAVVADLSALGGTSVTEAGPRPALTWAVTSLRSFAQHEYDPAGGSRPLRHTAAASLVLTVRDLGLLPALGSALARHEELQQHGVHWLVDDDNPAWPVVRADAIRAALRKGDDYAAALGCHVVRVEQVADVGLLEPGPGGREVALFSRTAMAAAPDSPGLDPVPQTLVAGIDARLLTSAPEASQDPHG